MTAKLRRETLDEATLQAAIAECRKVEQFWIDRRIVFAPTAAHECAIAIDNLRQSAGSASQTPAPAQCPRCSSIAKSIRYIVGDYEAGASLDARPKSYSSCRDSWHDAAPEPAPPSVPTTFRAGDTVKHAPSGETWVLACDEELGKVMAAGWPESLAQASDCALVEAATDDQRIDMLRQAQGGDGYRGSLARRQLRAAVAPTPEPPPFTREPAAAPWTREQVNAAADNYWRWADTKNVANVQEVIDMLRDYAKSRPAVKERG